MKRLRRTLDRSRVETSARVSLLTRIGINVPVLKNLQTRMIPAGEAIRGTSKASARVSSLTRTNRISNSRESSARVCLQTRMIRNALFLIALTMLTFVAGLPVRAETRSKVGTSAAVFLRIPAGARGSALGSAYTSMATDASVMFWNPGGIARLPGYQLTFDHTDWLPGIDYSYMGAFMPVTPDISMGVTAAYLSTEAMDITTPAYPMGTGETYDAGSLAVGGSIGARLTDRFSIGGTVKFIQERIYNSTANGVAFDVGTLFDTPFHGIRFGVAISNVGTRLRMNGEDLNTRADVAPDQSGNNETVVSQLKTDSFDPPMVLRLGLSGEAWESDQVRVTWLLDGVNPNDNAPSMNLGLEVGVINDALNLRAGYNDLFLDESIRGWTFGAGVNYATGGRVFRFDYAYQVFEYLGGVNRFTLSFQL